jgi:hypothetical protein
LKFVKEVQRRKQWEACERRKEKDVLKWSHIPETILQVFILETLFSEGFVGTP